MGNDKTFTMRTNDAFLSALDEWRRDQRAIPGRAEAVRILVEKGLEAEECCKKCNFAAGRNEEGSPIIGGGGEQAGT